MKLTPLNTSIVILAQAHNPTILHPAFLVDQGIVPTDWTLAEGPICTPAFAVVKFANHVVFTAEPTKLMILDNEPRSSTPIPELAAKYVRTLPHVRYTAVGINFDWYVECQHPEGVLLERFLKSGPGNDDKLKPRAAGFKLIYPDARGILNLNLDPGTVQNSGENVEKVCILVKANLHLRIAPNAVLDEMLANLGLYNEDRANAEELVNVILGLERTA